MKDTSAERREFVTVTVPAADLIRRFKLEPVMNCIRSTVFTQSAAEAPVRRVTVESDDGWSGDTPRVVVTLDFDASYLEAMDAFSAVKPLLWPITQPYEIAHNLVFHFGGNYA